MIDPNLLRISAVGHRLVVVVLEYDMTELGIRNVLYDVPLDREEPVPFVLLPKIHVLGEINSADHLGDSTELAAGVDLRSSGETDKVGRIVQQSVHRANPFGNPLETPRTKHPKKKKKTKYPSQES